MADGTPKYAVAVIGAGPAGIYAARELAAAGAEVALINRDIKPGGLAEYGIYYDKYKMKDGLRKQFRQILATPNIHYYGNVTIAKDGDLQLDELRAIGFQAIMVAVGAQGTKWLGLPGENLKGVYHAKDIVYHYNKLPPFSMQEFAVRGRVALVGVGNVMMDIAHWAIRDLKVDEVIAVARRGPAEVKFSKKEMEAVASNLDIADLDAELRRCSAVMQAVGQDLAAAREYILSGLPKAMPANSPTRFRFDFLASPTSMLGNDQDQVCGLEVEDTVLVLKDGDTKARSQVTRRVLEVDTVIFCIGDKVDDSLGLPVKWNEFVKNPQPRYPLDGVSFEAFDPDAAKPIEGVFVAGWSREASSGLVGVARKDGENGARALQQYLLTQATADSAAIFDQLEQHLKQTGRRVVTKEDITRLDAVEQAETKRLGIEEYKMKTNQEMLAALE
jgi:ferredoxin--NADP+ reductase